MVFEDDYVQPDGDPIVESNTAQKAVDRANWLMKERGLTRQLAIYTAANDFNISSQEVASAMAKRVSRPRKEIKPPETHQKEFNFESLIHKLQMLHEGKLRGTQKLLLKRDLRKVIKNI